MTLFPLAIFPERSLAESVITTVWVGVFVVSIFNLRLGWPFSGLVVPGYLVPLMISKPLCAFIICVEGFLTYFIVRFVTEHFLGSGLWCTFFGRDRFFALIVASLLVRLLFDGLILAALGRFLTEGLGIPFDYRNNLNSFGLIIVSLVANQFWKTGFLRGLIPFVTTNALSLLAVQLILIPLTNFNIGNLEYMYENMSSSFAASPKAYILLLTCAFIASRMNLLYGWDFNGILIPSLLALEWHSPFTIASTFLESFTILCLGTLALRIPIFKNMTMEGARKVLLFFNISFAYKMLLGHLQQASHQTIALTSFYGYGYLVSTLIAVKIHDKHILLRLTRATLQISLAGALIASLLGFILSRLPSYGAPTAEALAATAATGPLRDAGPRTLREALQQDKLELLRSRKAGAYLAPTSGDNDVFARALHRIDDFLATRSPEDLEHARALLLRMGYGLEICTDGYLYVADRAGSRGWGIFAFSLAPRTELVIEAPAPADEWGTLEAAAFLMSQLQGRAFAAHGSSRESSDDGAADVFRSRSNLLSVFHRVVAGDSVLQVRGVADSLLMELHGEPPAGADPLAPPQSILSLFRGLPQGLNLTAIQKLLGPYAVAWGKTAHANLLRDDSLGSFGELLLSRVDRRKLLSLAAISVTSASPDLDVQLELRSAEEYLFEKQAAIAEAGSGAYVVPKEEELLFLDEEVLQPLLRLLLGGGEKDFSRPPLADELELVQANARAIQCRIVLIRDALRQADFLALEDAADARGRAWGTFLFRVGVSRPVLLEVPRPLAERGCVEYAVSLLSRLDAAGILLPGAHPDANRDGSADQASQRNLASPFNLAHQVFVREARDRPLLVVQIRGFGLRADRELPQDDMLLALADGCVSRWCLSPLAEEVLASLESDDITVRIVSGDAATTGYEAYGATQAQYIALHEDKELAVLWLSPLFRSAYPSAAGHGGDDGLFRRAGIATVTGDLYGHLAADAASRTEAPAPQPLIDAVATLVGEGNIIPLLALREQGAVASITRLIDSRTRRSYLAVEVEPGALPAVFSLSSLVRDRVFLLPSDGLTPDAIDRFQRSLASRLQIRSSP